MPFADIALSLSSKAPIPMPIPDLLHPRVNLLLPSFIMPVILLSRFDLFQVCSLILYSTPLLLCIPGGCFNANYLFLDTLLLPRSHQRGAFDEADILLLLNAG